MTPGAETYHAARIVSSDFYEPLSSYQPTSELISIAHSLAPYNWNKYRVDIWYHVRPAISTLPSQGWKIHISATPKNCSEILQHVIRICVESNASFKFALDSFLVTYLTGKGTQRQGGGKFITIYPANDHHFRHLLGKLYEELRAYSGPYVLSDKRYKDCKVLYYRYGGIEGEKQLAVTGEYQYHLTAPDGSSYPDNRVPYWDPPYWVVDPFEEVDYNEEDDEGLIGNRRYQITEALGFSFTGGVYLAMDRDSLTTVAIKEARPFTGISSRTAEAVAALQHEFQILRQVRDLGYSPEPIEIFSDWEHCFLVEEYIAGLDLGRFTIANSPLLRLNSSVEEYESFNQELYAIWRQLSRMLTSFHARGLVLGDLSLKNLLISDQELLHVRLVDLETTRSVGDPFVNDLSTPGFADPDASSDKSSASDIYALGSIMLGTVLPVNGLLDLDRAASLRVLQSAAGTLGLPVEIVDLIGTCLSASSHERPTAEAVASKLELHHDLSVPVRSVEVSSTSKPKLGEHISNAIDYLEHSFAYERNDRLIPSDPAMFYTNPLNVSHGAAGAVYAMYTATGEIPERGAAWLISKLGQTDLPPGLYSGAAGVAWTLLTIQKPELAANVLHSFADHPLLYSSYDLYQGASGYGMAYLKFYLVTGDTSWLTMASAIGDNIVAAAMEFVPASQEWLDLADWDGDNFELEGPTATSESRGLYWPDQAGRTWLGYAKGSSGIALFLLYLSCATKNSDYLHVGTRALAFDLDHAVFTSEGTLSIPRGTIGSLENVLTHYWLDGSAGVATTLMRYWLITKNEHYRDLLIQLLPDVNRRFTVFPGLFRGLAGLGNTLLDAYAMVGISSYLSSAELIAETILQFRIERPDGIAFPGEQLFRISNDFGTGSSGIMLFLHRLLQGPSSVENFNFVLDDFLH